MDSNIVSNIVCGSGGRGGVGGEQPFSFGHNNLEMSIAHPSAAEQRFGQERG